MRRFALALAALGVLLAGCGGKSYDDPADLARDIGCTGYTAEEGAIGAPADVGTCSVSGVQVTVVVGEESEVDATVEFARTMAAAEGVTRLPRVIGDGWAVLSTSQAVAERVKDEIGGEIRR